MPRDNREVENTLRNKFAFAPPASRSNDHRWLQLKLPGLPPIVTKFSHTREDIGEPLLRRSAAQLRVRPNYLNGMIDFSNSQTAYYKQVTTDPYPPWGHLMRGTATQPEEPAEKRTAQKRRKGKRRR